MIIFSNIALERFFKYRDDGKRMAIRCKTPDDAYDLNYAFRVFGRTWVNGQKYDEHCTYYTKEHCCYTNNGKIASIQTCKKKNYIIINAEDFNDYLDHKFQLGDFAIANEETLVKLYYDEYDILFSPQYFSELSISAKDTEPLILPYVPYDNYPDCIRMPAISDLLRYVSNLPNSSNRYNTFIVIKIKTHAEGKRLVNILKNKFKMNHLGTMYNLNGLTESELSNPSKREFIRIQLFKGSNEDKWMFGYGSAGVSFDENGTQTRYAIKISDISKIDLPADEVGLDTPEDYAKDCYSPIKDNDFNNVSLHIGLADFGKFAKYNENDVKIMMRMMQYNKGEGEDNMLVKDIYVNKEKGTIVLKWENGDTTKVTCGPEDTFDLEKGVAMAIAKYYLGNNYEAGAVFKRYVRKAEISLSKQNKNKK